MTTALSGASPRTVLTAEQYSRLPEVIGFKDELIEGERVLAPMPMFPHTVVIDNIESLLKRQFPAFRVARETGWRFQSADGIDNVPGPDLMLLSAEDYDRSARSGGYFEGRPVFVVEVVSPSERKSRRLHKIGLYLEAGAGTVVEVDYTKRIVLVYLAEEDVPEVIYDHMNRPFVADLAEIFVGV